MIELITNDNNLNESDMTEVVKRVKVIIKDSNNKILLANSKNEYQFPGGHVEDNESLDEALIREIKEETGIEIEKQNFTPFALKKGYYKDWPEKNKNRKIEIYYYEIITDKKPNMNELNLTDNEKSGNFKLEYIDQKDVIEKINDNIKLYGDNRGIGKEMTELLEIYFNKSI